MIVDKMVERGVDSAFSTVKIPFGYPEEGLVVGEKFARAVTAVLPEVVPVNNADYLFFEGYRSKNGIPGFAVFAEQPEWPLPGRRHVVKIEFLSPDLADREYIPEIFFTGPQPKPETLSFNVEVPFLSLLNSLGGSFEHGLRSYEGFRKLVERIEAMDGLKFGMGPEFYAQFQGAFGTPSQFPQELVGEIGKPDEFGDGKGRYVTVVELKKESGPEFQHGNVRSVSPTHLEITDKHNIGARRHDYDTFARLEELPFCVIPKDIAAVYGKGLTQLYLAQKL